MRHGTSRALPMIGLSFLLLAAPRLEADDSATLNSLPDNRLGVRTAPILLLSRADVRADVALTEQQSESAAAAIADLHARASRLRGKSGEEAIAGRKAVDEAQRAWVDTNLSPSQKDRLMQIDLQWEGPTALISRPIVRDALSLSTEQQAAIQQAIERRDATRATNASPSNAESDLARLTLATLNEEQRTRWKSMLGRPFVPQLASGASKEPTTTRR